MDTIKIPVVAHLVDNEGFAARRTVDEVATLWSGVANIWKVAGIVLELADTKSMRFPPDVLPRLVPGRQPAGATFDPSLLAGAIDEHAINVFLVDQVNSACWAFPRFRSLMIGDAIGMNHARPVARSLGQVLGLSNAAKDVGSPTELMTVGQHGLFLTPGQVSRARSYAVEVATTRPFGLRPPTMDPKPEPDFMGPSLAALNTHGVSLDWHAMPGTEFALLLVFWKARQIYLVWRPQDVAMITQLTEAAYQKSLTMPDGRADRVGQLPPGPMVVSVLAGPRTVVYRIVQNDMCIDFAWPSARIEDLRQVLTRVAEVLQVGRCGTHTVTFEAMDGPVGLVGRDEGGQSVKFSTLQGTKVHYRETDLFCLEELQPGDVLKVWSQASRAVWLELVARRPRPVLIPAERYQLPGTPSPEFARWCELGEQADEASDQHDFDGARRRYDPVLVHALQCPHPYLLSKLTLGLMWTELRAGHLSTALDIFNSKPGMERYKAGITGLDARLVSLHDHATYSMLAAYMWSMMSDTKRAAEEMSKIMKDVCQYARRREPALLPNVLSNWRLHLHEVFGPDLPHVWFEPFKTEREAFPGPLPGALRYPRPDPWVLKREAQA